MVYMGPNKLMTRSHVQRQQWGLSDASSSDGEASPAEVLSVTKTPPPARFRNRRLVTCSRTLHKYYVYSEDDDSSSSSGASSPSWPSPVPTLPSPTAATPAASRVSSLHDSRGTVTSPHLFPAAPLTAVSRYPELTTLQSPAAASPAPIKTAAVAVPHTGAATSPHEVAAPSGGAVSKVAAQRPVPAPAAAPTAATPVSTPTTTPTRTPMGSTYHVELTRHVASAGLLSTASMSCPTTGRGSATALRAGAASMAKARGCSAQSRGAAAVLSQPASHQPRRMSSDQASVQAPARPAAPKPASSRATRASKASTATVIAAVSGVVTRSRAAAAAAKALPLTAAAQTDPTPAAVRQASQASAATGTAAVRGTVTRSRCCKCCKNPTCQRHSPDRPRASSCSCPA